MKEQTFVAREFEIFGGLDVDKKSIAVTFMSHQESCSPSACHIGLKTF
jgi:hypothetical protein